MLDEIYFLLCILKNLKWMAQEIVQVLQFLLTVCKIKRRESKPQSCAHLILPRAFKLRIGVMLQEPNYEHCVDQYSTSDQPHFLCERLHKHPC